MRARCRSLLPIVWVIGFALLIACGLTIAQDTITVDAVAAMRVCSAKNPASAGPCANPPKPISKENPKYPEEARRARHEGTVVNRNGGGDAGWLPGVSVEHGLERAEWGGLCKRDGDFYRGRRSLSAYCAGAKRGF
jgi:hypothetical protein